MKKKELKTLAKKIAGYEIIIQKSDDSTKVAKAKNKIMELSGHIDNLDDMVLLDEMVQELIEKNI